MTFWIHICHNKTLHPSSPADGLKAEQEALFVDAEVEPLTQELLSSRSAERKEKKRKQIEKENTHARRVVVGRRGAANRGCRVFMSQVKTTGSSSSVIRGKTRAD